MSPLIRDIIDVPVVETVVRLGDALNPAKSSALAGEFVITRQVERNLAAIAASIKEGIGRGHFLIGPYGSGKSHFLSYVSIVLAGEAKLSGNACALAKVAGEKKYFPIRVSLVKVRGETRLEEALLQAAEGEFKRAGVKISLTKKARFVEHVDSSIRAIDAAGMDAYLKNHRFGEWDELKKDIDKAAVAAWGYAKTLSGCPSLPDAGPEELISRVVGTAREIGFGGVIVVIDELSEFLRSKPSNQSLSEDARYLQFLGEFAKTEPFWIVASLQEAIEQAGDIERNVLAKIKDRYPAILPLTESHIRDLIDGRLIQKRDGARDAIRGVWRRFCECLPSFKMDFEDFYRVYPLHPSTIGYLENLSPLLSAHRGVVDFIVTQVRGDAKRNFKGILESATDALITVDAIYPHFKDRIRGDDRFASFDTLVKTDIERAITKIFGDEPDRALARRAIDVLILNEIAALEKPKTVSELAAILLSVISDASPEANEQYLSDVILSPLAAESLFLRCGGAKKSGDCVFRVSLERDSRGLLEKEIEGVLATLDENDSRPAMAAFESVPSEVPIREAQKGAMPEAIITWCGTQRRGIFLWAESTSPAGAELAVGKKDCDFAIVLGLARFKSSDGEKYPDRAIEWVPSWNKEELSLVRRYYALKVISSSGQAERAVKEESKTAVDKMQGDVSRAIDAGFRRGKFFWRGEEISSGGEIGAVGFFEKCAMGSVIHVMKKLHPRFLDVAPQVEFVSRRALIPLVDAIISSGKISMAAARKNGTRMMIEGVLIPMGLARVDGSSYAMQIDPSRSLLAREVIDRAGEFPKLADLMLTLRRGAFGLSREMASLAIVSLVRGGMLDLKKGGRRIPTGIVGLEHVDEADEIGSGELLPAAARERLFSDKALTRGLDANSFSLSSQRDVWERLLAARERLESHSKETLPKLLSISQYPVFDSFDFDKIRSAVESGLDAVRDVSESQGASKGLLRYLSTERPDLAELIRLADAARAFADHDAERIVRIAAYMADLPARDLLPEDIAAVLSDIETGLHALTETVIEGKTAGIVSAFDRFLEMYSEWYSQCHRLAFARERFEHFHRLRESNEWKALLAASSISGIHLVDGAKALGYLIDEALSRRCTASPSAELKFKAKCGCGFVPGKEVSLPDEKNIRLQISAGLDEAISALSEPQILERMVSRIAALRDIDSQKSARLEGFFHVLREGKAAKNFVDCMTPEIARLLDDALRREVKVLERDVRMLTQRLSGRRLPPRRVREIFDEWLGEHGDGEVLIDLGGWQGAKVSEDEGLVKWIGDHGLDETAARLALVISPSVKAAREDIKIEVGEERLKRMLEVSGLPRASTEECMAFLLRERMSQAFAWEAARRLAHHIAEGRRPESGNPVKSDFADVGFWCSAVLEATTSLHAGPIELAIRNEAGRLSAESFIQEHFERHSFPSENELARLGRLTSTEIEKRDTLFSMLPSFDLKFGDLIDRHPNAVFIFVDAASFDLMAGFSEIAERVLKVGRTGELWHKVPNASTAGWQETFFGTCDADAIASIFKIRGVKYAGGADFAKTRALLKEDVYEGPLWIRLGFVDRLIHSTAMPLYRIHEEAKREFTEAITDMETVIKKFDRMVLLSDHGFSEMDDASGGSRYRHDSSNISDTVAAVVSFEL